MRGPKSFGSELYDLHFGSQHVGAWVFPFIEDLIKTRAYIKCKRASLRSRAQNDILLDVTAHVCIIIP